MTQDHATNMRDLILNYNLDRPECSIIDFTAGKRGLWETEHKYKCSIILCDAEPTNPVIHKMNLATDDYTRFAEVDAGVADFPYKYGAESFDWSVKQKNGKNVIMSDREQGENTWAKGGKLATFTANKSPKEFIERVKHLNVKAAQCLKPGTGLLFCKVMDTRLNGLLIPNHIFFYEGLRNFDLYAVFAYVVTSGARTWKHHAQNVFGYWLVFKMKEVNAKKLRNHYEIEDEETVDEDEVIDGDGDDEADAY